jgi:hypothetical protein
VSPKLRRSGVAHSKCSSSNENLKFRQQPDQQRSSVNAPAQHSLSGQSVPAVSVNSQSLDNTLRVVTVVQQIMTEFNGAVSEEDKIVAITKIVLNLMKSNGH